MGRKSIGNTVLSPYSNGSIGSNKFKTLKDADFGKNILRKNIPINDYNGTGPLKF